MQIQTTLKLVAGAAMVATLGLATAAQAAVDGPILGTGFDSVVGQESGTDAFGQPWTWSTFTVGSKTYSAWGVPGLGDGTVDDYEGSQPATDFYIGFNIGVTGAVINEAPSPSASGYNTFTRFSVCSPSGGSCVAWAPDYISTTQVNFNAPFGDYLVKGDQYFVNVIFTKGTVSGKKNSSFTAYYSGVVPEPASWALMIVGAGAVGAMTRRRREISGTV
jgi:hypothetical protein